VVTTANPEAAGELKAERKAAKALAGAAKKAKV
jgi:hypothetical protein